jgi:hypothetical protein
MQENSLIKKNILQFIEYKGITKYKFYQKTGITRGILDQNNGMNEENIARCLAYFPEISAEWLLTGKGEMLKETGQSTDVVQLLKQLLTEKDEKISELNREIGRLSLATAPKNMVDEN